MTFVKQIIQFLESLKLSVLLPKDIRAMNPYKEPAIKKIVEAFYEKYHADDFTRTLIGVCL